MGWWVGIDEVGVGPNLGPLVVVATVWQTPAAPDECHFWEAMSPVVTRDPPARQAEERLWVGDSKHIFATAHGAWHLERATLTAFSVTCGAVPATYEQLLAWCQPLPDDEDTDGESIPTGSVAAEPWFTPRDLLLPQHTAQAARLIPFTEKWQQVQQRTGMCLRHILVELVPPPLFNHRLERWQNKALVIQHAHQCVSRRALRRCGFYQEDAEQVGWLISDRLGGTQYYRRHMEQIITPRLWLEAREETPQVSRYRSSGWEFIYQPRAESYLPVALASMIAKYIRECWMQLFNQFWQRLCPGLKPTQGYPVDARRFLREIESRLVNLPVPRHLIWRER
ncbi:MAG: hypothetical protein KatS3mg114_0390 [Planctomycetaceae bacterium]|nr:MAG: hypothetical protein KatS3mg114_0390 [Planctomycetaceae bacterium]